MTIYRSDVRPSLEVSAGAMADQMDQLGGQGRHQTVP